MRGRFTEALKIHKRRTKDNNGLQGKPSTASLATDPVSGVDGATATLHPPEKLRRDAPVVNKHKRATLQKGQHEALATAQQGATYNTE